MRVALLSGGRSGEHDVSLRSAEAIAEALATWPQKYQVVPYVIDRQGKWSPGPIVPEPDANPGIDVVFPVLHGAFGEDGTMQGLFELADLPYVGPGVLASSLCMDKETMKRVCRERGIPVVDWVTVYRGQGNVEAIAARMDFPLFVKPANLGSSVGISKANSVEELRAALELAAQYDHKIIVERTIVGQELECSVLGNEKPLASTPCEIIPSRDFYDYEDKYILDQAKTLLPANLTKEEIAEVRRIALAAYQALGCEGMARVDFLLDRSSGQLYVNEVNTIPGFTSISMFPRMLEFEGIAFRDLVDRLIQLALDRHKRKKATKFTR
ncbi:MAG: D-alanine--D-alanine ligase [Bryobacteraceae bacterium]|nr:D-alanine--D-alanine ligase [Bryobacteraceae bacterium]